MTFTCNLLQLDVFEIIHFFNVMDLLLEQKMLSCYPFVTTKDINGSIKLLPLFIQKRTTGMSKSCYLFTNIVQKTFRPILQSRQFMALPFAFKNLRTIYNICHHDGLDFQTYEEKNFEQIPRYQITYLFKIILIYQSFYNNIE